MNVFPEQLFLPFYLPDKNANVETDKCFVGWQFGLPKVEHPMYDADCSVGLLYKNGEFHNIVSPYYNAKENQPSWGWPRFQVGDNTLRARVVAPTEGQGSVPLKQDMVIELGSTTNPQDVDSAIETTLENGIYTCRLGKAVLASFEVDSGHVFSIVPELDAIHFELWSSHLFRVIQVQEKIRMQPGKNEKHSSVMFVE